MQGGGHASRIGQAGEFIHAVIIDELKAFIRHFHIGYRLPVSFPPGRGAFVEFASLLGGRGVEGSASERLCTICIFADDGSEI